MFTCCERKLIAEAMKSVNNNSSNLIKLTISMKPCELCKRIIEYTKKNQKGTYFYKQSKEIIFN